MSCLETLGGNVADVLKSDWRWKRIASAVAVVSVFVTLAIRLFLLISQYAVNLFFSDQWIFNNATLFQSHSLWEMFRWQHGPHRQGLGALVSYFIEPHFQWNSRTESFLIGGLIVISAVCALWLKVRLFGSLTVSDICIPFILFTPAQYGQIFVVANWSHGPLVLLLVVLYGIAWTISSLPWRYALVVIINFVAIYTAFGLFLGLITPFALTADFLARGRLFLQGKIYFAGSVVVSLASFASFFSKYTYTTSAGCAPNVVKYPGTYAKFISLMYANVIGAKGLGNIQVEIGMILMATMLVALAVNCRNLWNSENAGISRYLVAAVLVLYPLIFCAIAAFGRSCLGLPEAQVSRYVMYLEIGLLGLYFSVLTVGRGLLRLALLTVLTVLLAGTIPVRNDDRSAMDYYKRMRETWKACYLTHADIALCDAVAKHWIQSDPEEPDLKSKLDYLKRTKQNLYADGVAGNSP